jgi:hypothetical protein
MYTLTDWKDVAAIAGSIIATCTLLKGVIEYAYQGKQKRAEHFFDLRKKLKENEVFKKICLAIDSDSILLQSIPFEDKRDFLGLFEEVAIMRNSKLIKSDIAFYMFGYYAVRCWESSNFWETVNRESAYWMIFKKFAEDAKSFEQKGRLFNSAKFNI